MVRRATGRLLGAVTVPSLVAGLLLAAPPSAAAPRREALTATPLAPVERVVADKSPSSRFAQSDPDLLARDDSAMVDVVIKLDHDAVASYAGGIGSLAATSPSVTGRPLTGASPAERAYAAYQRRREDGVVAGLREQVPAVEVGQRLRTVYGGIAARVPADAVETVLAIDGVTAVQYDRLEQPLTDASPEFVNAPPAYAALGGTENAGEGVIYGNLDTGIWPEHPSFADLGNLKPPPGPARTCNYGDNPLTPAADPFVCGNKLIGGAPFLRTYLSNPARAAAEPFHSARDSNGHGTHTSSTTAGNAVDDVSILGSPLGAIHGMAPGAWVMEYKVCGIQGCFSSDSAAAVGQAVLDGVDVINFSISGGTNPFTDPVELAFLDAYAAGLLVSASAGNSGPGPATANHLAPWVTTVGASTQTREFATTLTLTAADGDTASFDGASITPGVEPLPVVLASDPPYGNALCTAPAAAGTFTGKIVACRRGVNARVEKGYNVLQGGAAAMILYNPTLADVETDTHWLPTVHLADGTDLVAFLTANPDSTGSFPAGAARDGQGDVMAAFSSRGPAGLFVKPDVTAPGVQILAGDTPYMESPVSGPPGETFQAIAGTSMSSPHVAGAAVLVRALHPDWTPGQVKSALMTTSTTAVVKEDLTTPADPFDMGAGRIDVGRSVAAALTFDESMEDFFALGDDPVAAVHLNLPSINAPVMPGRLTTTRVVTNTSGRPQLVQVSARAPEASRITVRPAQFLVAPGRSVTLTVTIESQAPLGEQQFAEIRLTPRGTGGQAQHLPVAFVHTQGSVALTQTCAPEQVDLFDRSSCSVQAVNNSFEEQVVDLDSIVNRNLQVVSADGASVVSPWRVRLHDVTLAGAQPGVPSVDPGELFGYLPLDLFGVSPDLIGDEEVINYDVPPFAFNGQTWTQVGVTSNGYVVAGGGTAEDIECCNLPDGPSPARPNNMVAPFWTDLDGTGAPGVFAAVLSDGTDSWLVLEYRLNVFGTTSPRVFQVWAGLNGVQDITYAYDPDNLPADPGTDFLVGAENLLGQGDMAAVAPTEDLRVSSTDPVPGDVASYTYTVRGLLPGTGVATTELRASGVPGVTVVRSQIEVAGP